MHIWDIYLRIFHWLLAPLVIIAIISIELDAVGIHVLASQGVCALVIFRIIWGVIGYPTARFAQFVKGRSAIINYLKGNYTYTGHNPLGALSVIALIGILILQIFTGLFTGDDVLFQAPLYNYVSGTLQEILQEIHELLGDVLILLIVLHVGVIIIYLLCGKNLIKPMINGGQSLEPYTVKYIHIKAFISLCVSVIATSFII